MRVVKHLEQVPPLEEVADAPPLEMFKVKLDGYLF